MSDIAMVFHFGKDNSFKEKLHTFIDNKENTNKCFQFVYSDGSVQDFSYNEILKMIHVFEENHM